MSQSLNREPAYHYAELAEIAALKEKSGDWRGASQYWAMAEDVARLPENRLWARSRAQYCGHEARQGLGYAGRSVPSPNLNSLKNARGTVKDDECVLTARSFIPIIAKTRYGTA
ncbi:ANR family transcriptional regulator [Budvicia aquatica]|uniref:ANR family transcriptional regulator n=1 Tax=Budvicia aquatica TaxID=82979 RepID=A0A2C6DIL4_9GAMM|nr:ANR family transcriptional regulator [Budvicia aquatica]PHI30138.1 hypothetical protein CRN84_12690 [Budvicia aquatica]VFS49152.1 Uncharacterised protein [Budvicia aquatica]